jgi:hypothetical protein
MIQITRKNLDDYLDLGHCIGMDNYYSLPKLFLELVKRKTDAVGTARLDRKSLPLDFKNVKIKKGEQIVRYYKTMMVQEMQSQVEKPTCV